MSIYKITDVTPVGAYMNAMKARHDGDRREDLEFLKVGMEASQ